MLARLYYGESTPKIYNGLQQFASKYPAWISFSFAPHHFHSWSLAKEAVSGFNIVLMTEQ